MQNNCLHHCPSLSSSEILYILIILNKINPLQRTGTPRRLAHGSGRRRSRCSAAHGRLARVSGSSWPWRPAELLLSSTASARPNVGTHGRRRLERELRERSNMAAGRSLAAFSCLCSARHGEAWKASPRLERELGECSAMAAGRASPAISWGRRLERDTGTYSRRSSAMAAGRAPAVSYLRSAGEQDAWLFAPGWSLGGSARRFFILGGAGCLGPRPEPFHDSVRA
jgi:hypothetical protein